MAHEVVEILHALPEGAYAPRVVHGMRLLIADECGTPAQRLSRSPDDRLHMRHLRHHSPVVEESCVAGGPLHPTDELGQSDRTSRRTGWRVRRARELVAQPGELRTYGRDRLGIRLPLRMCRHQSSDRSDRRRQATAQIVMPRSGPQHHAGGNAHDARERPAEQPRTDGRCRLGHGDREDEDEQRRRRRCGRLRRHDAREEHDESHEGHHSHSGPLVRRDDRSQDDQATSDEPEHDVGEQADPEAAREVHQQQDGEGTQSPQKADLWVGEEGMGETEHRRHDDGGPH